jgi:hypothetical protein
MTQKRGKQFEGVVRKYLSLNNIPFCEFDYRCRKCGTIMNSGASGLPDFLCFKPLVGIECKTGSGRLSKSQKNMKKIFENADVPYIVARDNIDTVVEFFERETNE